MKRIKIFAGTVLGAGLSFAVASLAHAQVAQDATQVSITSTNALFCAIDQVFDFLFYLLIALSVIMIIVAAYGYLTAQGDAEKVGKATKTLTYVAVAVAVALIAKGFPLLIGDIFSAQIHSQTDGCTYQ
jgi:hypothetical protein